MLKKLLSHSVIYALVPQLPKFATLLLYPILTRYLTAADYGVYGVTIAYVGIISLLKDLGLSIFLINSFYKKPQSYKLIWRHLHGLMLYWAVVYAVLLAIILFFSIPDSAGANKPIIILLSVVPVLIFENTQLLTSYLFRVQSKPLSMTTIAAASGFLNVGLTYYLIVHKGMGYMGWFYGTFIGSMFGFVCMSYYLYKVNKIYPIFKTRLKYIKRYFNLGVPMLFHNYSGYLLHTSDRVVMSILNVNISQIGFYNIAYTFGNYFSILETAVGMASSPIYLQYHNQKKYREARMLTYIAQTLFLCTSFIVCLWLREIFYVLVQNDELREAFSIGIIIIMGYNYKPMYQAATNILFYLEKPRDLLKVSFTAGAVNVVLNLILIPIYGIKAAAFTTFFCLMYMGFGGFFLKTYKENQKLNYYPMAWLSCILGLTALVYMLREAAVLTKVGISAGILAIAVVLLVSNQKLILQEK